jgi:hypothetical protein
MNTIKRLPHFLYAMRYDITRFPFVRESLYFFLVGIILTWMMAIGFGLPVVNPIIATCALIVSWIILYYRSIYPYVSRLIVESIQVDKYPHFNKRFTNKE